MNDLLDDCLNPKVVRFSTVSRAELGPDERLPRAVLLAHVETAIEDWACRCGAGVTVEDVSIEAMAPVVGVQRLRIDFWVEDLDASRCTYSFLCSNENGGVAYARGELTLVKRDRKPWPAEFRQENEALMKDLPAYA